ncbi:hypothetical protein [Teredinibacter purpureus]|uniref:hypothetical protein n=1 Tax=Teredinibacter purpureus TaxID=2731756 RepID=UPI0013C45A26|nr:hypothetical protein [Teredinibacter purpureus]
MLLRVTSMLRKIIYLILLFSIIGCAYDPYQLQVFDRVDSANTFVGKHSVNVYIVDEDGYVHESEPPYRIGIWLMRGEDDTEVYIDEISVSLNGVVLQGVSFKEIKSGVPFRVPSSVPKAGPAPCCRFMVISSDLPIVHSIGDRLDVRIGLSTKSSYGLHKSEGTVSFKAAIKKGLFRMVGV